MRDHIKSELASVVGSTRATDSPEDLAAYSYDAYTAEHLPDLVLFPISTSEVSDIMRIAHGAGISVTARGSGTNIAGESVPVRGGIALVLTRMDRILAVDAQDLTATVEPGVINFDLQGSVSAVGLMYPPDPASWTAATIGGNVATNAGGPKTVKYGVTRDYLLGLTVVLADGSILRTGTGKTRKVAGYDLTRLMCGSEGTLGVITEITVRLIPKPAETRTLRADFGALEDCGRAVAAIIEAGIVPAALELMDSGIVAAVESVGHLGLPSDVEGILIIEVDGDAASLDSQVSEIHAVLKRTGASGIVAAKTTQEAETLWKARRLAFSAMACLRPNSVTEDATVPVTELSGMIRKVREIARDVGIRIGVLAHAGDGNLHPLLLFDQRNPADVEKVEEASKRIFQEALAVGGTLSGEHGIGLAKAQFLPMELSPTALDVTRAIKDALDPKGILNPGKFV